MGIEGRLELLETAIKGIARKAIGEILIHPNALRIPATAWSMDSLSKFGYSLHRLEIAPPPPAHVECPLTMHFT
jgi:hypothetical protein